MREHIMQIVANLENTIHVLPSQIVVVHGDAAGADRMADYICKEIGIATEAYPADWNRYGKYAGPERNRRMLSLTPQLVVAFKEGFDHSFSKGGTEHMISIAQQANVPTIIIDPLVLA